MNRRPFLTTLLTSLLAASAFAQQPDVQLVHPRRTQPRSVWRAAMRPFYAAGIHPRLVRQVRVKLPRSAGTGIALLHQYSPLAVRFSRPGVRTVLLVPPPRDGFGRPVSSGVAPIGGDVAVCTFTGSKLLDVGCFAHELGHSLGATHRAEGIMNPSGLGALHFAPESVKEMMAVFRADHRSRLVPHCP